VIINLQALSKAEEGLNELERRIFENYFLGSLAVLIDEHTWRTALGDAAECFKKYGPSVEVQQ
jgi:hypothetical protein